MAIPPPMGRPLDESQEPSPLRGHGPYYPGMTLENFEASRRRYVICCLLQTNWHSGGNVDCVVSRSPKSSFTL